MSIKQQAQNNHCQSCLVIQNNFIQHFLNRPPKKKIFTVSTSIIKKECLLIFTDGNTCMKTEIIEEIKIALTEIKD